MPLVISALRSSVSLPPVMSVWIRPGVIEFTRTLSGTEFARHGLAEAQHAALGGAVVRPAEDAAAALRGDRRHADDRAGMLLAHLRDDRLAHVQRAAQVH